MTTTLRTQTFELKNRTMILTKVCLGAKEVTNDLENFKQLIEERLDESQTRANYPKVFKIIDLDLLNASTIDQNEQKAINKLVAFINLNGKKVNAILGVENLISGSVFTKEELYF